MQRYFSIRILHLVDDSQFVVKEPERNTDVGRLRTEPALFETEGAAIHHLSIHPMIGKSVYIGYGQYADVDTNLFEILPVFACASNAERNLIRE